MDIFWTCTFQTCIPVLKYLCDPSLSKLLLDDATWWSLGPSSTVEDWEGLEAFFSSDLMLLISFLAFARSSWALFTLAPTVSASEVLTEGRSKEKIKTIWKNSGNLNNIKHGYGSWTSYAAALMNLQHCAMHLISVLSCSEREQV